MAERGYIRAAILVGAAATALLRFLPFLLFGGKRGMPPAVRRLAIKMPPAIIAVLVVYCLKGVPGSGTEHRRRHGAVYASAERTALTRITRTFSVPTRTKIHENAENLKEFRARRRMIIQFHLEVH